MLLLAGRTQDTDEKTFGIVVFRCPDLEAARAVMQDDPAIRHGVMLGDLHPYRIAIQGRLETEEEGP